MRRSAKKILVVDDEFPMRTLLAEVLKDAHFNVLTATNGEKGLSLALSTHPDLIVLDLLLPHMSGIDMLRQLRTDVWGKQASVILLSNLNDEKLMAEAMGMGVKRCLLKAGLRLSDLIKEVRHAARGHTR